MDPPGKLYNVVSQSFKCLIAFVFFSLFISFLFIVSVVPLFPFTDMTPWQKCITIKCVWWRCNCHNLNEEKANKHRLTIYSGVVLSVQTTVSKTCLHILLHLAVVLCRSNVVQKIPVPVELFFILFLYRWTVWFDFSAVATWLEKGKQQKKKETFLFFCLEMRKWCAQEHLFRQGTNAVRRQVWSPWMVFLFSRMNIWPPEAVSRIEDASLRS